MRLRRRHLRERARIHLCHNRGAASCGFARCDHDDRLPPLPSATLNRSNPARHPALLLFILHPSHFILLSAAFCLLPSAFCLLLSPGPEGRKILAHRVSRGIRSASKSSPAPAGAKDIGTTRAAWFVEKGHEFTRAVNACNKEGGFSRREAHTFRSWRMYAARELNSFSRCYTGRAQTGMADMNLNKNVSLRENADTRRRVSAPPAAGGGAAAEHGRRERLHRPLGRTGGAYVAPFAMYAALLTQH